MSERDRRWEDSLRAEETYEKKSDKKIFHGAWDPGSTVFHTKDPMSTRTVPIFSKL